MCTCVLTVKIAIYITFMIYVPVDQTCPTVERNNSVENCVDECTSNDQCRYDRICCPNECGRRTCSDSVEMCQVRLIMPQCLQCCCILLS